MGHYRTDVATPKLIFTTKLYAAHKIYLPTYPHHHQCMSVGDSVTILHKVGIKYPWHYQGHDLKLTPLV